ncbi:MAG: class I SAM-dependent methyltransferase [Sulfurovaceae bacterium]|nr:class I SAM-dependent methyltransferase [Sulfurovaceae bacterium]
MIGYIEKSTFDIYECTHCDASFADPLLSNESIYNHIYRQVEIIPGYTRYSRFAELVKRVDRPLDVLANLENTYWSVRESLRKIFGKDKKDISILEIGSGLGYLTYSLNKAGYSTLGLDLSHEAVEKAKRRYGDFYEAGDLFIVSKDRAGRYDCIIMTEILEHVEDPKSFIQAALFMLKDGGKLIMTTPNKTKSKKGIIWQSDVPPVHLWWFSEKSIHMLAESFGKTCEFIDFAPYTKKFFEYDVNCSMDQIQESLPRLLVNGDVVPERSHHSMKSRLLGVRLHSLLAHMKLRLKKKTPSSRSSSMCAIITN